jgi:hypothetical protein
MRGGRWGGGGPGEPFEELMSVAEIDGEVEDEADRDAEFGYFP